MPLKSLDIKPYNNPRFLSDLRLIAVPSTTVKHRCLLYTSQDPLSFARTEVHNAQSRHYCLKARDTPDKQSTSSNYDKLVQYGSSSNHCRYAGRGHDRKANT